MDVTKVQKLNQMAVNLTRHNIVGSRDDAINRAASIYGEENNFSKSQANQPVYETQNQDLTKDVRKLMFAMQHLSNAFSELKASHDRLEKDFNDMRVGQQRRYEAPRQAQSQNSYVEAPLPQGQGARGMPQGQPQQMHAQQHQEPHHAQGGSDAQARLLAAMEPARTKSTRDPNKAIDRNNVAPSEVSIDKFFYSGSRR
jgi:hypothetical protein